MGRLVVRGAVSTGLTFTHADGRAYGAPPLPPIATSTTSDATDDAVAALRGLGFTIAQARRAVAEATSHGGPDAPLEDVLRRALAVCWRTGGRPAT